MLTLAGIPLDPAEDDAGLAAARRSFLVAAPLFRTSPKVDSIEAHQELFQPLWPSRRLDGRDKIEEEGDMATAEDRLRHMVRELVGFAGLETRPPLVDLLIELHRHETPRRLPPSLARLALPLSLHQAGLVPKAAPGLVGGRLSFQTAEGEPVTPWFGRALSTLAKEATGAERRLAELTRQHQAWHAVLRKAGLRGHARTPAVVDLLAATPVLSASLVAKHLGCTPQGAGSMLRQLVELGIVTEATPRARWKIYLAGDLTLANDERSGAGEGALSFSEPLPEVDRDAMEATLDELFADLERLDRRAKATLTASGGFVVPEMREDV
jgi:hypothetical protein